MQKESGDNDTDSADKVLEKQTDSTDKHETNNASAKAQRNGDGETSSKQSTSDADTADDKLLEQKVDEMINEKDDIKMDDLDNNGLLEDVSVDIGLRYHCMGESFPDYPSIQDLKKGPLQKVILKILN